MTTPALEAIGLTKRFRCQGGETVTAVDGIDLTIGSGEIVAFLGPNGAGKDHLRRHVPRADITDERDDRGVRRDTARAVADGRVSAVMQTGGLLPDFTVRETIRAIAALHGRPERVMSSSSALGWVRSSNRLVKACSGGEQQRLKFALALVPDPELVILDEPTTGMDVSTRQEFWNTMRADAEDGRTIVFATHYLAEAMRSPTAPC
jgi:ABC-2 type transport system ATP-binding protein